MLRIGLSFGPVKAMLVTTLGRGWRESVEPQIKLYGAASFMKGSTTAP